MTAYGALWPGTSSPTMTRLGGANGWAAGAGAVSNFNGAMPWGGMRRCNLSSNGIPLAWNNGTGGGCGYSDTGTNNVMVTIPQYCLYIDTSGTPPAVAYWIGQVGDTITLQNTNSYTLKTSDIHPAFVVDGVPKPYIFIGAYQAYNNSGVLQSISGVTPIIESTPLLPATARGYANANGTNNWGLTTLQTLTSVWALAIVEYATWNLTSVLGAGQGTVSTINTGGTVSYGNTSYGGATATQMSYRGVEALWGSLGTFAEGINVKANSTPWVAPQSINNTYACDTFAAPYADTTHTLPAVGFVSAFYPDWMFIASSIAGSPTPTVSTYLCVSDGGQPTSNRVVRVGSSEGDAGAFGVFFQGYALSTAPSYPTIGYRIQYLPR